MVNSRATSAAQYLSEIPNDQRDQLQKVRLVVKRNLGKGFDEAMNWWMISYQIPLSTYPTTYNKKPLMFAALAAQKHNISLYLMCIYQSSELLDQIIEGYRDMGKKPNMGKSCIRFKSVEDIPLEIIGKVIKEVSLRKFIGQYELAQGGASSPKG